MNVRLLSSMLCKYNTYLHLERNIVILLESTFYPMAFWQLSVTVGLDYNFGKNTVRTAPLPASESFGSRAWFEL